MTPEVVIRDNRWILRLRQEGIDSGGATLREAVREMEQRHNVKVSLPRRYRGFTHIPAEEYKMTVEQAGA